MSTVTPPHLFATPPRILSSFRSSSRNPQQSLQSCNRHLVATVAPQQRRLSLNRISLSNLWPSNLPSSSNAATSATNSGAEHANITAGSTAHSSQANAQRSAWTFAAGRRRLQFFYQRPRHAPVHVEIGGPHFREHPATSRTTITAAQSETRLWLCHS